jgi:hypothetical protein
MTERFFSSLTSHVLEYMGEKPINIKVCDFCTKSGTNIGCEEDAQ